jgi:hypothetical protein
MAKLNGPLGFSGNLKGLSAYTMQGCEGIILRTAYGPSGDDIETKPAYDITRRNNKEFGGCSSAAKWIRRAFHPLKTLEDYNLSGALTGLLKPIMEMDLESEFGKRHVLVSRAPQLLTGLNFNRKHIFDSVVRNHVAYALSRESLSAKVEFPALLPSFTFFPPGAYPYYRIVMALGLVPDLFFTSAGYGPNGDYTSLFPQVIETEWYPAKSGSPALKLDALLPSAPANKDFSLMLSVGIQMGSVGASGAIEGIKYAGSGKILAIG